MNKNLIFRILGIVGSCLIIISLFLPFVNYEGFTSTLFENAYEQNYVPYVLISFSVLSIVVLLLNKKIELAYITVGSALTIAIIYTFMYRDSFAFLSFGYYLLLLAPILIFVSVILQSKKEIVAVTYSSNDNSIVNNNSVVDNNLNVQDNISQPNELAQSIMDQPVMRDLSVDSNQSNLDNLSNTENNSENITLAPQNPLNQFLSPGVGANQKQVDESVNNVPVEPLNQVTNENKVDDIVQNENKSNDESQSILSIMNQPMVSSQSLNSINSQVVQPQNTANVNQLGAQALSSMAGEPVINPEPVSEVAEPTIPVTQVAEVQPVSEVAEPTVPVNPITEVQPVIEVAEPTVPEVSISDIQQGIPEIPLQPIPAIPEQNNTSVFDQGPIKFD